MREFLRYACIAFRLYTAQQPQHAAYVAEGSMGCNACRWLYRFAGHHGSEWSLGSKKGKPQANRRKLFVAFRDKSVNNLTIRQHCVYSSALAIKKHPYSIQTSAEIYRKFERSCSTSDVCKVIMLILSQAIPLQVWTDPQGSKRLRLQDF